MKRRDFLKTIVILPVAAVVPKVLWGEVPVEPLIHEGNWLPPERNVQLISFSDTDEVLLKGAGLLRKLHVKPKIDGDAFYDCFLRRSENEEVILHQVFSITL